MKSADQYYFEFTTALGPDTVVLVGTALGNALIAFGFDEDHCGTAGEVVARCCAEIVAAKPDSPCRLTCRFQRNGSRGLFTISTDACGVDLSDMAAEISSSPAWSSFIDEIAYAVESSTIKIAATLGDES